MRILDINDPADAEEYRQLQYAARMKRRPFCQNCGRRIWTETYLKIDNICYCRQCVDDNIGDTAEDFDYAGE